MTENRVLVVTSLLSLLLLTLHVTDDIVRGISKAEPSDLALLVLVIFVYGPLMLAERRSGHVIMLLVGVFAAGMPVIHMRGVHYPEIARSAGGFFFVWTLWALGGLGGVTVILSARGLWRLRRGQTRQSMLLAIHIAADGLAILFGAVPLSVKKRGRIHRRSGVLFVYAMLVMGFSASILTFHQGSRRHERVRGQLTADLVGTALTTARPASSWTRVVNAVALIVAAVLGLGSVAA